MKKIILAEYETRCKKCGCTFRFNYNDTYDGYSEYLATKGRKISCPECFNGCWFSIRSLDKIKI